MKTFQLKDKPNILYFTNLTRMDEEELFQELLSLLQANEDIAIGDVKTGPSEDCYECTISAFPFTLMNDINYGPSIYSKDVPALKKLAQYLN